MNFEFYEMGGIQAVRFVDYKANRTPIFTGPVELYNVTEDPHEDNNLAEQQPELVAKAAAFMDASHVPDPRWQASKGAAGRD